MEPAAFTMGPDAVRVPERRRSALERVQVALGAGVALTYVRFRRQRRRDLCHKVL
jgi:hypothetical protein